MFKFLLTGLLMLILKNKIWKQSPKEHISLVDLVTGLLCSYTCGGTIDDREKYFLVLYGWTFTLV